VKQESIVKGSGQNQINVGLGLAVLIFIVTTVISYWSTVKFSETADRVAHTRQVLETLEALISTLRDAETDQRGYVITGDERFLELYQDAVLRVDPLVRSVRTLTEDNPNQQRRLDLLEPLILQRLNTLKEVVDFRNAGGFEAAKQSIAAGKGKREMDQIDAIISEMKNEENRLLVIREHTSTGQNRKTILILAINAVLGLAIFFVVFYLFNREGLERRRAEGALSKQTRILESVLASMGEGVVVADMTGKFLIWNPAAEQIIQLGKLDIPQGEWAERYGVYLPDQVTLCPTDRLPLSRAIRGESVDGQEFFIRHARAPEGIWVSITGRPLKDEIGTLLGGVVVIRDITEQKWNDQARRESEEESRSIIETATSAFIKIDFSGLIVDWNRQAESIFGWSRAEALGRSLADTVIPPAYREAHQKGLQQFLATGVGPVLNKPIELTALHRDGREFPVEMTIWPLRAKGVYYFNAFVNDISNRKQAERTMEQANVKLTELVGELEARKREMSLLSEMGELLQTCRTLQEADGVIAPFLRKLFPTESGALYILASSRNIVERNSVWGSSPPEARVFPPDECWALRRGQLHRVEGRSGIACRHVTPSSAVTLCIPMQAQSDMLGILHLILAEPASSEDPHEGEEEKDPLHAAKQKLAVTVTEQVALALSNIRLRETLRNQAIRDPLTGLFNRRYLEEVLEQEISRAERNNQQIGVIMIDIDHFKRYNDTYGHEAGDAVLSELGRFLERSLRGGDTPCRYGGEEFMVLLPGASLESALLKAERLREEVKQLNVQHRDRSVGAITLSLGVACYPDQGSTGEGLLRAADQALYQAKVEGRDRVVSAAVSSESKSGVTEKGGV